MADNMFNKLAQMILKHSPSKAYGYLDKDGIHDVYMASTSNHLLWVYEYNCNAEDFDFSSSYISAGHCVARNGTIQFETIFQIVKEPQPQGNIEIFVTIDEDNILPKLAAKFGCATPTLLHSFVPVPTPTVQD